MNASATAPLSAKFQRISAAEAAALLRRPEGAPRPVLFDVRDRASYERAHVSGAEHLTDAHLGAALRRVPKSAAVMIYCYHGNASQVYAETFADFRFAEVYSVDGGYEPLAAALALLDGVRLAPRLPDGASADLRAIPLLHYLAGDGSAGDGIKVIPEADADLFEAAYGSNCTTIRPSATCDHGQIPRWVPAADVAGFLAGLTW